MTPERWRRITAMFHLVRAHDPKTRAALLDDACGDDSALRFEVEELLRAEDDAGQFGQTPLVAVDAPRFAPGTPFGAYQISGLIGAGGMGEVYRAHDTRLDRDVAIKVLSKSTSLDADARLLREARSAAALNHPHVCTIYEVGETNGHAYIAMELVEGKPLDQMIPEGGLPIADVIRYGVQIAEAIAHAHDRGIVHRDLKPGNITVSEGCAAKVLDFGLAKNLPLAAQSRVELTISHTAVGLLVGTAAYMSPEQALGRRTDHRSDIFSLGSVLYEMATGRPAFNGSTPMEVLDSVVHGTPEPLPALRRDLPNELAKVIERALEKDPAHRYQDASALADDLQHAGRPAARWIKMTALGVLGAAIVALLWATLPAIRSNLATRSPRASAPFPADRTITEVRGLYAASRWDAALEGAKRALDLDPNSAAAWALLGKIYARRATPTIFAEGSVEEPRALALAAAKRAVEIEPELYDAYVSLALAYREASQLEPWRAAARRAIAIDPQQSEAYAVLGDSYADNPAWGCARDRDSSMAISYYRQALQIEPTSIAYHVNLTNYLRYAGRLDEALRLADDGLRIHPTTPGSRRVRAWVLVEAGRFDEAERMLREAQADNGPRVEDHLHLAVIELKRGRPDEAASAFRKAVPAGGEVWRRSVFIARHYIDAGLLAPALEQLEDTFLAEPACANWLLTTKSPYWMPIRQNEQARTLLEKYAHR